MVTLNNQERWRENLKKHRITLLFIREDITSILEKSRIVNIINTHSNKSMEISVDETGRLYAVYKNYHSGKWFLADVTNGIGEAPERYTSEGFCQLLDSFGSFY